MKQKRKLGRKPLSFLLTLAMLVGLMPGMTARAAGNGTEADPIEITSWAELSSAMSGTAPTGESADSPTYYKLTQNVEDTSSTGAIQVGNSRYVVLDLYGNTIDRKLTSPTEPGYVIRVRGNLTIKDSVTGGKITGGYNDNGCGGGVYIDGSAKFNMKGGTISGNTADTAGGVYVSSYAEFTMEGGTISGNTAIYDGGGVYIGDYAKFNMKGGTISGNLAKGNYGGGVYLYYDAEFCLSGRPIINDNKLNGNTVNVHILDGTIKLTGALESGASVGVTMENPGVFTSSVDPIKASVYKDCFSSDNSTYTVTTDGNELKLSSHEHDFTYSATGATITATCNASDRETTCPLKDNSYKATLTIGTPTGEDGKAVLAANPSGSFDLSALQSTIKYSSKQSSGWSTESTTPPTGDGFHKAAITLGEGDKAKTASVTYGRNVITYNSGGNGSVSGTASATVGSKIEFTVTPSANYTIDAITVKDADNQNVTLTGNAFTMPEKNVTVSATFKAIAYTVTVNGGKATVKDNTPNPVTFTAELKVPNDKMYDGTPINLSTATVEKSDGFPSQVEVGTISYKDQAGNAVTNPTNVGTYTASVSVGDKTISKSFKITGRTPSITYTKTTKSGNSYVITKTTTDQYIPLENNAGGITLLDNGRTYVAEGNLTIGALIFKGDAKLILRKDSKVTVRAGIYHIGSTLELYTEEGGENAALDVKGDTALSGLTNYSDYSSQVEGGGSSLSGTILIYGGKVTVEKGENTNFVANDISMTVGAGISAKGLTSGSDLSELTGGTENRDGSVTYTFTDLSQFSKLFIEYRIPSSVTTAPTAKSLTYSGTAQELVTAGEATGGTMQYALGTATKATQPYTTSIPTATDAGTYYIWYKVVGDENHFDSDPASVTSKIRADISKTVTFKVVNGSWDDGDSKDKVVKLEGFEGDTIKLTADKIPAVGTKPSDGYKEGSFDVIPVADTEIKADTTYTYTYAKKEEVKPEPIVEPAPVQKIKLTVTAKDQTIDFGGAVSEADSKYVIKGLQTGDEAVVTLKADAKKYTITPVVTVKNGDKDVTENYDIEAVEGKLAIKQVPMVMAIAKGNSIKATTYKIANVDGYLIYTGYCGGTAKLVKTIKGNKAVSYTYKKIAGKALNRKKASKVIVKAYRLVDGKKVVVATSMTAHVAGIKDKKLTNASKITVKAEKLDLKKGNVVSIGAKVSLAAKKKAQLSKGHAAELRYASSNKAVATIDANGKIKAVGKGTCIVYAVAVDGVRRAVKVTVK